MSKKLAVFLLVCSLFLLPGHVSAHVLIKDKASGTGAILHVNPDDDPIAGERASLFYDIRDSSINPSSSDATLSITDDQGVTSAVPSEIRGSSVSATYNFPRQGLYRIRLVIERDGTVTHTFMQAQRVSRGIIGGVTVSSTPAWAEAGIIFTLLASAFVAIVVFNRRENIGKYSKW